MSQFEVRPATRKSTRLLIGLYGESGSGKTKSALLLARGIAGPSGKVVVIDTEAGRAEFFADEIPGGYEAIPFASPFSPSRYVDAISTAENQGADVIIVDSASHEWEGQGGVLDLAGENEQAGKKALAIWKLPKLEHAKFVLKLMQAKCTVIVCLRAKFKSRQVKNARGFTEIVKDEHLTPIQAEDFLFELTLHMQVNLDHSITVTKEGRKDLRSLLPANNTEPLRIEHGAAIAQWASNAAKIPGIDPKPVDATAKLKKELWDETKPEHGGKKELFEGLLRGHKLIEANEDVSTLSADRLTKILSAIRDMKAAAE